MTNTLPRVKFHNLGLISYKEAWDMQTQLHKELVEQKRSSGHKKEDQTHHLLFCEHPAVYTLGRTGDLSHLLLSPEELSERGLEYYKVNRGGDITHHGPGQIVVYPIFDLDCFFTDVHKYVRLLEQAVINTLIHYGLQAERIKGFTGVWLPEKNMLPNRKICAIGVHLSRWVTLHGLAFNINNDLSLFRNIVPCGIVDENKVVTSLSVELDREISIETVSKPLMEAFRELFEFEFVI